jgi:transposase-like protein
MMLPAIEHVELTAPQVAPAAEPIASHWSQSISFNEVTMPRASRLGPTQPVVTDPEIRAALLGRPTKYKEEFNQLVLEDMLQGYTLSAFAGRLCVAPSTVHEWMQSFPEFSRAVARGKALRQRTWETEGLTIARTGGSGSQATMVIFGLKNMGSDEWRDKQEVSHSGQISLGSLVETSMKTIEGTVIKDETAVDD